MGIGSRPTLMPSSIFIMVTCHGMRMVGIGRESLATAPRECLGHVEPCEDPFPPARTHPRRKHSDFAEAVGERWTTTISDVLRSDGA